MEKILWHFSCMLPGMAGAGVLYFLLLGARRRRLAGKGLVSGGTRETVLLLFWMFCGGMAVLTLSPDPAWLMNALHGHVTPFFRLAEFGRNICLHPFRNLNGSFLTVGNIVMFVPFGFFAGLLWRNCRLWRAFCVGLGITFSIESWQLLVGRTTDVDDVLLNLTGALGGWLVWRILQWAAPAFTRRFRVREVSGTD